MTNLLNILGMGEREKDADKCECVCVCVCLCKEIPGESWWRGEKEKPTCLWQKFLALPCASCATRKLKLELTRQNSLRPFFNYFCPKWGQ